MKKDAPYYLMEGWKKMKGMLTKDNTPQKLSEEAERKEPETPKATEEPSEPEPFDYTAWQLSIRDSFVRRLSDIVGNVMQYPEKSILVFLDSEELFRQAQTNDLGNLLNEWVDLRKGQMFRSITLRKGIPPVGFLQTRLDDRVVIAIERRQTPATQPEADESQPETQVHPRAEITVISGCCTFKDGSVQLKPQGNTRWNIGFGEFNNFSGRMVRYNQIALQYADPTGREKDPYPVSRAHAHIIYKPGMGYWFYVDPRGTNKRTQVQKGEKIHKAVNPIAGIRLEDKDVIILNNEMLLFRITE